MEWNKEISSRLQFMRFLSARMYYVHGLICASHPYSIISMVMVCAFFCCLPLTKLPLPGYAPLEFVTPINEFVVPANQQLPAEAARGTEEPEVPEWLHSTAIPESYIQQIAVKASVLPWSSDLIPIDAIRSPLGKVFEILNFVGNFSSKTELGASTSLRDKCFHVQEVLRMYRRFGFLSEFDCLIISPANIWDLDLLKYQADSDILGTVFAHEKRTTVDSSPGFKDVAFGIPWSDTGIKQQTFSSRKHGISFAVTIVLRNYDRQFIKALTSDLKLRYPEVDPTAPSSVDQIVHIRFQAFPEIIQFLPLILTYAVVLMYLCFTVSKLEMVKSKAGLAISAVVTIIASLAMSAGLCSYFGLNSTLSGGEIFPYLVVIIGLENVIVITKSVVTTPVELDVKFRIAQGLSREGWGITKNFFTELLVLLLGYLTYVPAIQEFCMFGFVGLLSDMFLQLVFFSAVLSIDIGRMELSDHISNRSQSFHSGLDAVDSQGNNGQVILTTFPEVRCPFMSWISKSSQPANVASSHRASQSFASAKHSPPSSKKVPRRVRLLWFFGSNRVIQRALTVITFVWIVVLVYQSGYVLHNTSWVPEKLSRSKAETELLAHVHKLSYRHWPTLFGYYNISLSGKFISILPPISLSISVSPEEAIANRHPLDHKKTPWKEEAFIDRQQEYLQAKLEEQELWVLIALGISTAIIFVVLVLHGLRLFWPIKERYQSLFHQENLPEAAPFLSDVQVYSLAEHILSIENLVVDEDLMATSCFAGQLKIWNWNEVKPLRSIKRVMSPYEKHLLNRDGTRAVDGSGNGTFETYILKAGRQIWCLALKNGVVAAGCADGVVELYEARTGVPITCYVGPKDPVTAMDISGDIVIAGKESGTVDLLLLTVGSLAQQCTSKLHLASVSYVTVMQNYAVTVGQDDIIKVLRWPDWVCIHSLPNPSAIMAFFLDQQSMVACGGYDDGNVQLWNLISGSVERTYSQTLPVSVRTVSFSERHVTALNAGNKITLWSRTSGLLTATVNLGRGQLSSLCIRLEFLFVATLGDVQVLDLRNLKLVKTVALDGNVADYVSCPTKMILVSNSDIVCDYGRQIRILRFFEENKRL